MAEWGRTGEAQVGRKISELLREFRMRECLTQEELAERSGVSARTIRALELGARREPRLSSVRRLAQALALPAADWEALVLAMVWTRTCGRQVSEVSSTAGGGR